MYEEFILKETPLVTKGVELKTVQLLYDRVLYPDQRLICVGKGKVIGEEGIREGLICITNRTLTLYQPDRWGFMRGMRRERAYDYKLIEVLDFSYNKGWFSSEIEIQMDGSNKAILQGITKGEEEPVISFLKQNVEERKRFENEQRSKGLFRYGFPYGTSVERWGSREKVQLWLEQYLVHRGFKKLDDKWVTKQKYLDYERRQKGLYKYIEVGIEKWGTIDEILDGLSPSRFEDFVSLLFKSMGYEVTNLPYVGDYGADVLAKRNGRTTVVQVKKWKGRVGAPTVQKTLGSTWKYKANKAILITTGTFTWKAYEQSKGAPIELWDRKKLKEKLEQYLPSNLVPEKPIPIRMFPELEKICKSIISQVILNASPQTAMKINLTIKKPRRDYLEFSVSGPFEYISILERVIWERIPTIPIQLKGVIKNWLKKTKEDELELLQKTYPDLIKT